MESINFLNSFSEKKDQKSIIDEDKVDEVDTNKENSDFCEVKESSKRSSRLSILTSLDPFNPYNTYTNNTKEKLEHVKKFDFDDVSESSANTSINLLKFDSSMTEDVLDEVKTPTKRVKCGIIENDFISPNNSPYSSNISQMLNESIEKNDVETDNLIGLSPIQKVVDLSKFNNVKKYHNEKKQKWLEKEKQLEEIITNLKKDYETKINDLLTENEENVEKMRINHLKILTTKQIENDKNLEKMRINHTEIITAKQIEKEEILKDMDILITEMEAQESGRLSHMVICDQYYDTLVEVINDNEISVNKLQDDNKNVESMLKNYFLKVDQCTKVIESLKTNQSVLISQIEEDNIKIDKLTLANNENDKLLLTNKESNEEEVLKMKVNYEKKLKLLEVKSKHLENIQSSLKVELNLRINERDQLTERINELLKEE